MDNRRDHCLLENNEGEKVLPRRLKARLLEYLKPLCEIEEIRKSLSLVTLDKLCLDIFNEGKVNTVLPEILSALLNKENGLVTIKVDDLKDIIELLIEKIINQESFDDIVFSIGMGGSVNAPNVRIPAYIISAIKTLKSFQELEKKGLIKGLPKVRIFKANHLSSKLNGLLLEEVSRTTGITFDFLKAFMSNFFPEIQDRFEFAIDQPVPDEVIEYFLSQANLLLRIESIRGVVTSVLKMGEKHGGENGRNNALIYAVAHPFYGGSIVKRSEKAPKMIIDFGGKPQERFNGISRQLIDANKKNKEYHTVPTIYAIVKSGKIPVYYTARDGDLPISSNFTGIDLKALDRATHTDYAEIFSLVDKETFEAFTRDFINQNQDKLQRLEK